MNNVDLDIQNYNYDELLSLFKIKETQNRDYLSVQLDNKINQIKSK